MMTQGSLKEPLGGVPVEYASAVMAEILQLLRKHFGDRDLDEIVVLPIMLKSMQILIRRYVCSLPVQTQSESKDA